MSKCPNCGLENGALGDHDAAENNAPNLRKQPADVNSCGIWCPKCGAHLRGPAAPALTWKQLAYAIERNKPDVTNRFSLAELVHIVQDLNALLVQPTAPRGDDLCAQGNHFVMNGKCTACGQSFEQ